MIVAEAKESQRLLRANVATYDKRLEEGVRALAKARRGGLAGDALSRFRWVRARLGKPALLLDDSDDAEQMYGEISRQLPSLFELVATFGDGKLRGFGYSTQGRPGSALPENLADLAEGALRVHFESGGKAQAANHFGKLFRLAFPSLERLREYSPLSLAMYVGVVPAEAGYRLKLYFNTRLGSPQGHKEQLAALLAAAGVVDDGLLDRFYDALYVDGTRFYGVGVDLEETEALRTKLYLHLPREQLAELPQKLRATVAGAVDGAHIDAHVGAWRRWLDYFQPEDYAEHVELATALAPGVAPEFKLAAFFAPGHDAMRGLTRFMHKHNYPAEPVRAAVRALEGGVEKGVVYTHALHAAAVEHTSGRPRVNVYLQPPL